MLFLFMEKSAMLTVDVMNESQAALKTPKYNSFSKGALVTQLVTQKRTIRSSLYLGLVVSMHDLHFKIVK